MLKTINSSRDIFAYLFRNRYTIFHYFLIWFFLACKKILRYWRYGQGTRTRTLHYQIVVAPRLFILRKIVNHYKLIRCTTIIEICFLLWFSVKYVIFLQKNNDKKWTTTIIWSTTIIGSQKFSNHYFNSVHYGYLIVKSKPPRPYYRPHDYSDL